MAETTKNNGTEISINERVFTVKIDAVEVERTHEAKV
jgi:hypothetical protein